MLSNKKVVIAVTLVVGTILFMASTTATRKHIVNPDPNPTYVDCGPLSLCTGGKGFLDPVRVEQKGFPLTIHKDVWAVENGNHLSTETFPYLAFADWALYVVVSYLILAVIAKTRKSPR